MKTLLPHPAMSGVIAVAWLVLTELSVAHAALAVTFALVIPLFTQRFMPGPSRLRGARAALVAARLMLRVTWDIVRANVWVARLVLGRASRLKPAFVLVPLEVDQSLALALLASIVTMTPGTVSAEFSRDRRHLLVHVLHTDDAAGVVANIKARYERPLREIFL